MRRVQTGQSGVAATAIGHPCRPKPAHPQGDRLEEPAEAERMFASANR
ncbi:MAG: hypothetical protein Fur0046_14820 [Cyanobacteria bacterium J069]